MMLQQSGTSLREGRERLSILPPTLGCVALVTKHIRPCVSISLGQAIKPGSGLALLSYRVRSNPRMGEGRDHNDLAIVVEAK